MQDNHGLYCLILTSIEKEVMYFVKDMESTCQPMKTIHNCYRFNFITITSTMTRIIDMNAIFNILSYFNTILSEYSAAKESIDIALSSFIVKTDRSSSPPPLLSFFNICFSYGMYVCTPLSHLSTYHNCFPDFPALQLSKKCNYLV